jgi:hypothetical protein
VIRPSSLLLPLPPLLPLRPRLLFASMLVSAALAPGIARGDDRQACVDASMRGQTLRDGGHLVSARRELVACAAVRCPDVVREHCARWLDDVERRTPTVVFRAADSARRDVTDARVLVDGEVVAPVLDGRAIALDPGAHLVRFERAAPPITRPPGGREPPVQTRVVLAEGEHARAISVVFPAPDPGGPRAAPGRSFALPITLGAIGATGAIGFAVLGLMARGRLSELRATCAPHCAQSDLDVVTREANLADVFLVAGALAVGGAIWALLTGHAHDAREAPRARAAVGPGGA